MSELSDKVSVFEYHGRYPSDSFSLSSLYGIVDSHFNKQCVLVKMTQGGYHKVYEIFEKNLDGKPGQSLEAVARVASPAFPCDKLRSEVATLQYIRSHTSVPVPAVYEWNVDASNPVGAEYMIMQKIPGVPAVEKWDELSFDIKDHVVQQVAMHLASLFALRFSHAGSLYFSSDDLSEKNSSLNEYRVGPVVSDNFYRAIDGEPDYPSTDLHVPGSSSFQNLQAFRGPFSRVSEFITHPLRVSLYKWTTWPDETIRAIDEDVLDGNPDADATSIHAENEALVRRAVQTAEEAVELAKVYPGDAEVYPVSTPDSPFTFLFNDFRLVNIMIDAETGTVTGLIDFEGAVLAPTWMAAAVPDWIPDPDGDIADWYGGTPEEQRLLWKSYHETVDHYAPEWREAYVKGTPFREVAHQLIFGVRVWGDSHGTLQNWVIEKRSEASTYMQSSME